MTSSPPHSDSFELDPLVETLREMRPADAERGPHLDATDLAAWVDHALDADEGLRIEAHLAACATCRALAIETRAALAGAAPAPVVNRSRWRTPRWPAWTAAAVFLFVILGGLLVGRIIHAPPSRTHADAWAALGLHRGTLPSRIETWIDQAIRHEWPSVTGLASFDTRTSDTALRNAATTGEPLLLGPRWSTVPDRRPALHWLVPGPASDEPLQHEVLLLDVDDRLVFAHTLQSSTSESNAGESSTSESNTVAIHMPFPRDAPSLSPGRAYAWRVSTRTGDDWHASAFVPFRVLSTDESSQLDDDLDAVGPHEAARAVVLAQHGVLHQAIHILTTAREDLPPPASVRDRWIETLLRQQHLSDDEIDRTRGHDAFKDASHP